MTTEFKCTQDQFDDLSEISDKAERSKKETVKVPKAALAALLWDYAALIRLHNTKLNRGF